MQTVRIEKLDGYWRVPISDAARTLLCDFAAGDLARPLSQLDVDWEEVFQGVCRNGLLGLTQRYLGHRAHENFPPALFRDQIQRAHRISTMRLTLLYGEIARVLARLLETGIDFMVIKGPALAHRIYPDPLLRPFNDLDLVVRERDWATMHQSLTEMGFASGQDLPEPPPKLVPKAILYELQYFHPEMTLVVEVHYDDLFYAGLAARNVEKLWQRAVQVDLEGLTVKTLSLEDQLIQLCLHAHLHGYGRLGWFSDWAFIVRDCADALDWDRLCETVRDEDVQVGVYYSLHFLERLLGVGAPASVMAALRPDRFRRWWHERYQPEAKVLSLQPMDTAHFSFYFRPFLRRLLPDLLVMGRRREKLHYLWRLLTPPRQWLVHHYALDPSPLKVWPHYLLHPLKFFFHIAIDVIGAIGRAAARAFRRIWRALWPGRATSSARTFQV